MTQSDLHPGTTTEHERALRSFAAVLAIAFALGLHVLEQSRQPADPAILDTHVRAIQLESTRLQGLYFLGVIASLAAACTALLLLPRIRIPDAATRLEWPFTLAAVAVAFGFGSYSRPQLVGAALAAGGWLLLVAAARRDVARDGDPARDGSAGLLWRVASGLMVAGLALHVVAFLGAPLTEPLVVQSAAGFRSMEAHYAVTVLSGYDLLCCGDTGTIARANYGVGLPLVTASMLELQAWAGQSGAGLVTAVKLGQLLAAALVCVLALLANRRAAPFVIAFALGTTAYTMSNIGLGVVYPNQSGLRYVPMLAALIVLVLELRRPQVRTAWLASASAAFVLLSPETGLATTAGCLVAAVLARFDRARPFASVVATTLRFLAAFAVAALAGSALVRSTLLGSASSGPFEFVALFAGGGYGGLVDRPSVTATLMVFAASACVLHGAWRARTGELTRLDVHEASLGTVMLVWLMYYVNRMHEWNLWFELVLLALLLAPRLSVPARLRSLREVPRNGMAQAMVATMLAGGAIVATGLQFQPMAAAWLGSRAGACRDEGLVAGACLPWLAGSGVGRQIDALRQYPTDDTLVLTALSTYVRTHGFNDGFPWYDAMEPATRKDAAELTDWIERQGPGILLVDDPAGEVAKAKPEHSEHILGYLPDLPSYREQRRADGWIVLVRSPRPKDA